MRPFILKSAEFNRKKMVVIAYTDEGVYEFPVLPALKGQKETYITKLKKGRYAIFTKDYSKLKRGDFGEEEEIKLTHEVLHYDWRVVAPYYSTAVWSESRFDKTIPRGLRNLFKLTNLFEDLSIYHILLKMGKDPIIVEKVNSSPTKIKELSEIYNKKLVENFKVDNLSLTLFRELPLIKKFYLPRGINFNILEDKSFIDLKPKTRIKVILLTYRMIDYAIPSVLKKFGNFTSPRREDLIKIANTHMKNLTDPFHKMRWNWELESLKKHPLKVWWEAIVASYFCG